jgi:starch synthase
MSPRKPPVAKAARGASSRAKGTDQAPTPERPAAVGATASPTELARHPLRILFATSEAAPYWRTGGLADVARSLPDALAARGHTIRIVHPFYPSVRQLGLELESAGEVTIPWPGGPVQVELLLHRPVTGASAILVRQPDLFETDRPYEPTAVDPIAHIRRFAFFSRVVLELARMHGVDILHLNDWPTGLVPAYALGQETHAACLFAIHNLAHQGNFPPAALAEIGIPSDLFRTENGLEFHGSASCLKAGLSLSDRLVTVSPTYAREIQTPEFGAGFDGLLRYRRRVLHGLLNGIDTSAWDPAADASIPVPYDVDRLELKEENRRALLDELGLEDGAALLVMVTRLAHQKGIDLVLEALPRLLRREVRLAVLGDGDPAYHEALATAAAQQPGRVAAVFRFDDGLARRFYAGGDFFLMPSRFEPCGLGQMLAQSYGTPPIVRHTGGLVDTVQDGLTGFSFGPASADSLLRAVGRAIAIRGTPAETELRRRCMQRDNTWHQSARQYELVYSLAIGSLGGMMALHGT